MIFDIPSCQKEMQITISGRTKEMDEAVFAMTTACLRAKIVTEKDAQPDTGNVKERDDDQG
jgi:hypothetical protein